MIDKHIVAGSGGFRFKDKQLVVGPVIRYALKLAGKDRPKLCYLGTASGDTYDRIASFYNACSSEDIQASHLQLFPMPNHANIEEFILSQDVIWVGGGSVDNLLAVWKVHGLDKILRKAWDKGIILSGSSAGSICWNIGGTTDSYGLDLKPTTNGLGLLPYSDGVHYDTEEQRRPVFHELIKTGVLPNGYATDDEVSLHFIGTELKQAISDTKGKFAYYVYLDTNGIIQEDIINPLFLK